MVHEQMQTSKNMMHSSKIQQHGPPQGPHCQFFKFSFLSKFTCFNTLPKNVQIQQFLEPLFGNLRLQFYIE